MNYTNAVIDATTTATPTTSTILSVPMANPSGMTIKLEANEVYNSQQGGAGITIANNTPQPMWFNLGASNTPNILASSGSRGVEIPDLKEIKQKVDKLEKDMAEIKDMLYLIKRKIVYNQNIGDTGLKKGKKR